MPKAIFLDEAWAVTSTPEGAKLVPEVSRMGRSRNTALILVSQNAGDLLPSRSRTAFPRCSRSAPPSGSRWPTSWRCSGWKPLPSTRPCCAAWATGNASSATWRAGPGASASTSSPGKCAAGSTPTPPGPGQWSQAGHHGRKHARTEPGNGAPGVRSPRGTRRGQGRPRARRDRPFRPLGTQEEASRREAGYLMPAAGRSSAGDAGCLGVSYAGTSSSRAGPRIDQEPRYANAPGHPLCR